MSELERGPRVIHTEIELAQLRRLWKGGAARAHFGACDVCGRRRTGDDRPLWVVQQQRSPRFLCFECWIDPRPRRRLAA